MGAVTALEQPLDRRTERQLLILSLCARGYSREEIGRELYLSPWTVKVDLDRLRETIGARNVTHAVSICMVAGDLVVVDERVVVGRAVQRELALAV